jgi:cytochrome c-type biogenesis protein CcmH
MRAVSVSALLLFCGLAFAQDLEKRAAALEHELRCLVCQNQSLAESNAPLAQDLRNEVREQLAAGKSDDEVKAWLVARYGDFVLYRPPLKASTVLLWAGPFLFLAFGFFLLMRFLRRKPQPAPELTPAERERAAKLLE